MCTVVATPLLQIGSTCVLFVVTPLLQIGSTCVLFVATHYNVLHQQEYDTSFGHCWNPTILCTIIIVHSISVVL